MVRLLAISGTYHVNHLLQTSSDAIALVGAGFQLPSPSLIQPETRPLRVLATESKGTLLVFSTLSIDEPVLKAPAIFVIVPLRDYYTD
jgi:hypothetical protein